MTPPDGDGLVTPTHALAELALDDATRAEFEACWDILCAAPPPELAERHIRASAAIAAKAAAQPRFTTSGRSLARAAVISAVAFVGTTGLAAAEVLPPAAAQVVEKVAETVRTAINPLPDELSVPAPTPAPKARTVTPSTDDTEAGTESAAAVPSTTQPLDTTTSVPALPTTTTVTTLVEQTTTTTLPDDGTATQASPGSTTTTTTVPDDGTATAAGEGSTTTSTRPSSSTTSTTQPSSSTTTTTPPPTTTP